MKKPYRYTFEGTGGNDQAWTTTGSVECEFVDAFDIACERSFEQLTHGKAVYGNPGKGGCRGPYEINRVVIELASEEQKNAH